VAIPAVSILEWPFYSQHKVHLCNDHAVLSACWYATPVKWMDYLGKVEMVTHREVNKFVHKNTPFVCMKPFILFQLMKHFTCCVYIFIQCILPCIFLIIFLFPSCFSAQEQNSMGRWTIRLFHIFWVSLDETVFCASRFESTETCHWVSTASLTVRVSVGLCWAYSSHLNNWKVPQSRVRSHSSGGN
jgi:hypothetical protein